VGQAEDGRRHRRGDLGLRPRTVEIRALWLFRVITEGGARAVLNSIAGKALWIDMFTRCVPAL
jgi:hypothetical protein